MLETMKGAVAVRALRDLRASRALRFGALLAVLGLIALASAGQALASGITNSGDDLRDGWYPEQPSLTPQLVSGGTFGQLWSTSVEGQVYAQPLLANGTLLVATENNKVYGLDPATGAMRWPAALNLGTALEGRRHRLRRPDAEHRRHRDAGDRPERPTPPTSPTRPTRRAAPGRRAGTWTRSTSPRGPRRPASPSNSPAPRRTSPARSSSRRRSCSGPACC